MNNQYRGPVFSAIFSAIFFATIGNVSSTNLPDPFLAIPTYTVSDTIPVEDNKGDFLNDPNKNPFDIIPSNVKETVEFDPVSGKYILTQKIGDEYYRMPTYMTFEEYINWRQKEDQKNYFSKLAGVSTGKNKGGELEDPMASIDVANSLVDRLFGGTEVNIQPQGQVDVTLQSRYSRTTGALARQPVQINPLEPQVAIRVSVDGNIGSKMNLGFNYDTQSTFDFDRKIKLEYDTEAFGEDDIIKKIEAGNVSLPLRSNLIQGAQSLFGLKTELQFGHLRITAIASQQQSEQRSITIENGASIEEFELSPDQYDENRHFFLSHFHRDNYETALVNLPQISSAFRVADLEVWISDDRPIRNNLQSTTTIAAVADIAEHDPREYEADQPASVYNTRSVTQGDHSLTAVTVTNPITGEMVLDTLPENDNNGLGALIEKNREVQESDQVRAILNAEGFRAQRDFEVFQGRRLSSAEFSYNEQLGFLSLNIRLRPNQVLAVAYTYFYSDQCLDPSTPTEDLNSQPLFQVGQLSVNNSTFTNTGNVRDSTNQQQKPSKVIFTKMLKSSSQPTNKPSYDLMMKNVYSLRASQLDPSEFSFDIFFEDDSDGTFKKFLPEPDLRFTPLLNLFNLDRLNKFNDPQSDGVFDYVPGVTIIPRSGTVVFPVLEPFGDDLPELVVEPLQRRGLTPAEIENVQIRIGERYAYQALYDTSITIARQGLERNKFRLKGFVKSATSGEINLGPFVPENGVNVRAGGIELIEGSDYEIDYSLGILRIINDSYLQQGTPLNVTFEDQTVFSLQQKNMMGLRADYNLSKKASVGGTILKLSERPFTTKVNLGSDPINNTVYGLDYAYSSQSQLVTKIVDKLPFYSTNAESSINFYAEGAFMRPGYSDFIEAENVSTEETDPLPAVSIEDFEGAINGLLLGGFNTQAWRLASTPDDPSFPEARLSNDLAYGANRARLSWYSIDRQGRNAADLENPYTRFLDQQDIFPNRDVQIGQSELISFDLSYFPDERGPYNYDEPDGIAGISAGIDAAATAAVGGSTIKLNAPETRWAGIMRAFQNPDFEQANYEFIEFWMLNPYMDRPDGIAHDMTEDGKIVIHLGNVSEDILKDGLQMYENALPEDPAGLGGFTETAWGRSTVVTPLINGFSQENGEQQDLGYDGLTDELERVVHEDYLNLLMDAGITSQSTTLDPAADNYQDVDRDDMGSFITKSKLITNPEGNAPLGAAGNVTVFRGNRFPDTEDMNNNRSLDNGENYYTYEIPIRSENGELNTNIASKYITDIQIVERAQGPDETWYRFRVPINDPDETKNITGFRSIQFMRMYMTGFKSPKIFRLAEFQILRNLWRRNETSCVGDVPEPKFSVDEVGIQENGSKLPFNYVRAPGILEEDLQTTFARLRQDERSMALKVDNFSDGCEIGINKLANLDLTLYEKLQLYVHAELDDGFEEALQDGDLRAYVKLGKDQTEHYYEYEIPLTLSKRTEGVNDAENVWPRENVLTVDLKTLTDAKRIRIERDIPNLDTFRIAASEVTGDFGDNGDFITVRGTPSLARIKVVEVGIRNRNGQGIFVDAEAWVNELRLLGLSTKGSVAGEARLQIQMADLGEVNATANYSSIGWGALDQRLAERNRREIINYDLATNLRLDKFFPEKWGLSIPFYAQYSSSTSNLQFEPYEGDLTVDEKVESLTTERDNNNFTAAEQDSIDLEIEDVKERSRERTTIKTFNFTNVKVNSKGTPKPWSPSNVSVSYAYTETESSDFLISSDNTKVHNTALNYNYSKKANYVQPLKSIKSKHLKLISEFNFNPIPNSFTFGMDLNRQVNIRRFRLPVEPVFQFDDKRFFWNRDYGLNWDLTKSLKFTYRAKAESIIDELRQVGIDSTLAARPYVDENGSFVNFANPNDIVSVQDSVSNYRRDNFRNLGRSKNYSHNFNVTYNLPIRYLPFMDWVTAKAEYKGNYSWQAGALVTIDDNGTLLGNTIQNGQTKSINATLSFDKLYSKSKYLKDIDKGKTKSRTSSRSKSRSKTASDDVKKPKSPKDKKKDTGPSTIERVLIRPLLTLRNIKVTYREEMGTTLPGFMVGSRAGDSEAHGLIPGVEAPGLGFIAGLQPDVRDDGPDSQNFLDRGAAQGWFNPSTNFNGIFTQTLSQTTDIKIALEPVKDLDVDIDFKKSYTETYTDQFKAQKGATNFSQGFDVLTGSYNFTHIGLSTMFDETVGLYNDFRNERQTVSRELARTYNENLIVPHRNPEFEGYFEGFGPENSDVAIPAFLKVYLGQEYDISSGETFIDRVSQRTFLPAPNWNLKYDGLAKLPLFDKLFTAFSIRHAYIGTTTVGSFASNPLFDNYNRGNLADRSNGNYFSEINTPTIRIADQFAPLIGLSVKLKNEMTFDAGYNKARTLSLTQLNLAESFNSEITFGFGYTMKNIKSKGGKRKTRSKKGQEDDKDDDALTGKGSRRGKVSRTRGRTLTMNLDFSLIDNVENIYELGQNTPPTINRGTTNMIINPSVDYDVNKNLTMRFFVNYNNSITKTTVGTNRLDIRGGATAMLKIN